jgi:hypothetical protein
MLGFISFAGLLGSLFFSEEPHPIKTRDIAVPRAKATDNERETEVDIFIEVTQIQTFITLSWFQRRHSFEV